MFSIITPTYNRAHTLNRVYTSLINQIDKDFEWIIIDDASTDSTKDLVEDWKNNTKEFKIYYFKLSENRGKPYALNTGLEMCSRPITIIADSDDSFVPSTLCNLKQIWNTVDLSKNSQKIGAVWTLVVDEKEQLVGDPFPTNFWQVNLKDRVLNRRDLIRGEKWHSWRTDILKIYKMNHNDNSFISEGSTWNRINKDYDFLCINLIHRKYWISQDGLILQKKSRLVVEKQNYYNAYYQLSNVTKIEIFKYSYYHQYCFNYIKSRTLYKDSKLKLTNLKLLLVVFLGIYVIPKRIIHHFKNSLSRNR